MLPPQSSDVWGEDPAPPMVAMLRLLLEQASEYALLLLDPQGRITAALAGAENVLGYTSAEMAGMSSSVLFTPKDIEWGMPYYELRVAREYGKAEDDRWQVRKSGARFWASGITVALRNEQGDLVGYGKILRDRTNVKAQIEALENRIQTLTRADERKNIFIGMLGHELGNTFASMRLTLELARKIGSPSERVHQLLCQMERQVELTGRLLNNLTDVTRIEAGNLGLEKKPVLLVDILEQAVEICRPLFDQRRQQLHVLTPPTFVLVDADPLRLHEVFVNLLNNASKFTPDEGRIAVRVTTDGDDAVVIVEDTGMGIGPDLLPRLFGLFTQAEASPKTHGGLGLGLWLVKNLVTLHGGTVSVRSEGADRGSEFSVRLPLKAAIPVEDEPYPTTESPLPAP